MIELGISELGLGYGFSFLGYRFGFGLDTNFIMRDFGYAFSLSLFSSLP